MSLKKRRGTESKRLAAGVVQDAVEGARRAKSTAARKPNDVHLKQEQVKRQKERAPLACASRAFADSFAAIELQLWERVAAVGADDVQTFKSKAGKHRSGSFALSKWGRANAESAAFRAVSNSGA